MDIRSKRIVAVFCVTVFTAVLIAQSAPVGFSVNSQMTGTLVDYWPSHQNIQGDTQYCIQTAATYANGVSAGTSTYIDQSGKSHVVSGQQFCTANDTNINASSGNILLYTLNTLDMTNAANISISQVLTMSSFGSGAATNSPPGWFGKVGSNNLTNTQANWKSEQPWSALGWIYIPVFRQEPGSTFYAHDGTLVASPDGGAHWLNPYNYWHLGVSNVACTANVVTLTTATAVAGTKTYNVAGGDVIFVHGANAGANGEFTTTAATAVSVSYAASCSGVTTGASSGYASIMDATGDAPICAASGGTFAGTCTDPAFLDTAESGAHSSMMWQEPSPYNGTTGFMQAIKQLHYCQDEACTGMPNNADNNLYFYGCNGRRQQCGLSTVPKTVDAIMNPASYTWYFYTGYTPTNTGNGSTWTATQASATALWGYLNSSYLVQKPAYPANLGYPTGNANYLCAGSACAYVLSFQSPYNSTATASAPWGPFNSVPTVYPVGYTGQGQGFWHVLPWTAATIDTAPYHLRIVSSWDTFYWGSAQSVSSAVSSGSTTTLNTAVPASWVTSANPMTITVAGSSCGALNSTHAATPISATQLSFAVNTVSCGAITGTITWAVPINEGTQYWQPTDYTFIEAPIGAALSGNSGVRISMAHMTNAIPRAGLYGYWDFWDNRGVASAAGNSPESAVDIANYPPTMQLSPCLLNGANGGCGFYLTPAGNVWSTTGLNLNAAGGYLAGLFLFDLTGPAGQISATPTSSGQINPAMFVGDTAWSISAVAQFANVAQQNRWFGVGTSSTFPLRLQIDQTTAGNLCAIWSDSAAGGERGTCSNGALIGNNTWYALTITKTPGAILGGPSGTVRIYINGAEITAYNVYTYGSGKPNGAPLTVASGPMFVASGAPGNSGVCTMNLGQFMIYQRALPPTEVLKLYQTERTLMSKRGVTLP